MVVMAAAELPPTTRKARVDCPHHVVDAPMVSVSILLDSLFLFVLDLCLLSILLSSLLFVVGGCLKLRGELELTLQLKDLGSHGDKDTLVLEVSVLVHHHRH